LSRNFETYTFLFSLVEASPSLLFPLIKSINNDSIIQCKRKNAYENLNGSEREYYENYSVSCNERERELWEGGRKRVRRSEKRSDA